MLGVFKLMIILFMAWLCRASLCGEGEDTRKKILQAEPKGVKKVIEYRSECSRILETGFSEPKRSSAERKDPGISRYGRWYQRK
jgi:hypothetical protein